MSVIFSASLFFMSFVPLWISILFIDVKSIVTGGEIRTEVISIIIIVTHAFIIAHWTRHSVAMYAVYAGYSMMIVPETKA